MGGSLGPDCLLFCTQGPWLVWCPRPHRGPRPDFVVHSFSPLPSLQLTSPHWPSLECCLGQGVGSGPAVPPLPFSTPHCWTQSLPPKACAPLGACPRLDLEEGGPHLPAGGLGKGSAPHPGKLSAREARRKPAPHQQALPEPALQAQPVPTLSQPTEMGRQSCRRGGQEGARPAGLAGPCVGAGAPTFLHLLCGTSTMWGERGETVSCGLGAGRG